METWKNSRMKSEPLLRISDERSAQRGFKPHMNGNSYTLNAVLHWDSIFYAGRAKDTEV